VRKLSFKKIIVLASFIIFWLMVLPYPFEVSRTTCSGPCRSFADYSTQHQVHWVVFGGYHIFVERFLPKSGEAAEVYASKYYGTFAGGVVLWTIAAVGVGFATYVLAGQLSKYRTESSEHKKIQG
jgi:hypothetical protein